MLLCCTGPGQHVTTVSSVLATPPKYRYSKIPGSTQVQSLVLQLLSVAADPAKTHTWNHHFRIVSHADAHMYGTSRDGKSAMLSSVATLTMCMDTPSFAACVHCSWTSCAWSMTRALPLRIAAYTHDNMHRIFQLIIDIEHELHLASDPVLSECTTMSRPRS